LFLLAASLELLPIGTRTELGDALVRRVKVGDFRESELWCLSRLGARELFYGPINLVVPPATVTRWVEALLPVPAAGDALAALARKTQDPTRDLSPTTFATVRRTLEKLPNADRYLAVLDAEEERDEQVLGRIFGEELPSGLALAR
jgi:DNA-K related protein